ncbi:hypothetical protein [Gordonia sp. NPDC003585]|uniref:hypothetical protein n=1 Tax=Gordonia sp. NPDC003585 TaxID=3154275 RepID=UPI0033B2CDF3
MPILVVYCILQKSCRLIISVCDWDHTHSFMSHATNRSGNPMQRALRPIATTTIAFASVTALALGPMTTPPALTRDVGIESPAIVPTATWTELVQNTSANLDHLIPVLTADPLPVLSQILDNNLTSLGNVAGPTIDIVVGGAGYVITLPITAVQAIQALFGGGGIEEAAQILIGPLVSLVQGPGSELFDAVVAALTQPFQNFVNALGTITLENVAALALGVVSPLLATVVATVEAIQNFVGAVNDDDSDFGDVVQSLIDFIPTIVDGALNGADVVDTTIDTGLPLLPPIALTLAAGGLLSPAGNLEISVTGSILRPVLNIAATTSGTIVTINNYLKQVAEAITPVNTAANRLSSENVSTFAAPDSTDAEADKTDTEKTAPVDDAAANTVVNTTNVGNPEGQPTGEPEGGAAGKSKALEVPKPKLGNFGKPKDGDTAKPNGSDAGKPEGGNAEAGDESGNADAGNQSADNGDNGSDGDDGDDS